MTNIWAFMNQTISVSVVAGLLLLVKWILKDKLSPKWQYSVWGILVLRIVLPVNVQKALFFPVSAFVECLKGIAEKQLPSAYVEVYETIQTKHIIPFVAAKPISVTDWIFVVYVSGVICFLLWYLFSYLRLRSLLRKGQPVTDEMSLTIDYVCAKYGLKACDAVMIPGLTSSFICGGFPAVLVLPAEQHVDEKIILHELLHLKYHDELQSIGWCILRSLHWCNPFLQYVFNEIGNDMESLCDQRVLEQLEGEERREYGVILLGMANEKYARVPGTSSISNGGKNISKRIASIVRFKKYPKGMALVSVCITFLLMIPSLLGADYAFAVSTYNPSNLSEWNYASAIARVNRCTTVAGAVDTYAKGLFFENEIYVMLASPLDKHEEIEKEEFFEINGLGAGNAYYEQRYESTYTVWNVQEKEKDVYTAYIVYGIKSYEDIPVYSIIVPIEVRYEDAWVVRETGERVISPRSMAIGFIIQGTDTGVPGVKQYAAKCDSGAIRITTWMHFGIDNLVESSDSFFDDWFNTEIDRNVKLDAEFTAIDMWSLAEYSYAEAQNGKAPEEFFGILYKDMDSLDENIEFEKLYVGVHNGGGRGDESWVGQEVYKGDTIDVNGLNTILREDRKEEIPDLPAGYAVRIFWDGKQVEEVIVPEAEEYIANNRYDALYGKAQYSTHISSSDMNAFQYDKKLIEIAEKDKLPTEEMYEKVEAWAFADKEGRAALLTELERAGIYYYETSTMTDVICAHTVDTVIYEPEFFFNANDGTWIVVFYGYCTEDFSDVVLTGSVGMREQFGIEFVNTEGVYKCGSLNVDQRSSLSNEDGSIRKENRNSSGGGETGGIWFELQDYTWKESVLAENVEYIGYRWYGAVTYAPGFENMEADVVAYYNHTN